MTLYKVVSKSIVDCKKRKCVYSQYFGTLSQYGSNIHQGAYRQDCVKFKDFQGLLKDFPTVFKDGKIKKILIYTLKFYFGNARVHY